MVTSINVRTGRLEEVNEATQVGRGIGLVEVPFVERKRKSAKRTFSASLSKVGRRLPMPCLKARLPLMSLKL